MATTKNDYKIKQIPEDFIVQEISPAKPEKLGNYAYFWMKKKNHNTLKAVKLLSDNLKIGMKRIGWAGNKDKNAVTTQLISLNNAKPSIAQNLRLQDVNLKYFGQGSERIFLGNLIGNKFEIVIRNISNSDYKTISDQANLLKQNDFFHSKLF